VNSLDALTWPITRLGDALHALAWQSGLAPRPMDIPGLPEDVGPDGDEALGHWMEAAAAAAGLEADRVETSYAEVDRFVRTAGPALLCVPGEEGGTRFLALARGGWRAVSVLGPDLAAHSLRPQVLRAALCRPLEAPLAGEVAELLAVADVPQHRRARARETILRQRLGPMPIGSCWLLRLPPGGSFWLQAKEGRLLHLLLGLR
jgi:ATP-binding cassette subfamily B protein